MAKKASTEGSEPEPETTRDTTSAKAGKVAKSAKGARVC